jgi:SAM-dependent methyltransferase
MDGRSELDRWDRRFSTDDYLFGTAPNAFLASQAHRLRPGMRALAVADGEGRNGVWLAGRGLDVTSMDGSAVAQDKARRLAAAEGVALRTVLADIRAWTWEPEAFDLVAAIFIQFAPPDLRTEVFRGIVRTLRPGGLLLLQGYRPEQLAYGTGGPPHAAHMYDEPMLRAAFADLEMLHLASHDDVVAEGRGHDGMSALIDLAARKPA